MDTCKELGMKTHYVYRITDLKQKRFYVGVRSCICAPIDDIGVSYFTSSTDQEFSNRFRNEPNNFKIKIVFIGRTRKEAVAFEIKYHSRLKVATSLKDISGRNNPNFGNKLPIETRLRIREKMLGRVTAKNLITGEFLKTTTEEFLADKNIVGSQHGTIMARDIKTNEVRRVQPDEFDSNENLVGVTKGYKSKLNGLVYAYDRKTKEFKFVPKEIYHINKDRYQHNYLNKINCINIETGESFQTTREEFEKCPNLVGIRKRITCPICLEKGIGKKFRWQHFKNCKKENNHDK